MKPLLGLLFLSYSCPSMFLMYDPFNPAQPASPPYQSFPLRPLVSYAS